MKKFVILALIFLAGCLGALRPDQSMPSLGSGYPSVEFTLESKNYHGLGLIAVPAGTDLSSLHLLAQGVGSGEMRMDSEDCELGVSQAYTEFAQVRVPLSGPASRNCLITVTVSPHFPQQAKTPIEVFGFRGTFAIRVIQPGESWVGSTHKVSGNFSHTLSYHVGGSGKVRAVLTGCGVSFDESVELDEKGILHLELASLVHIPDKTTCVLEGVVISPVYKNLLINELVASYDPAFTPLSYPAISLEGRKLKINAPTSVSVLGFDGHYQFTDTLQIKKFDPTQPHRLNAFTVKGRSVLCEFAAGGSWQCQQ